VASARTASGCGVKDGTNPLAYLAFHRSRSGWPSGGNLPPKSSADMIVDTTA